MSYLSAELAYRELPPLLTHTDGTPVTAESWSRRREELLELLYANSYGRTPAAPAEVRWKILSEEKKCLCRKSRAAEGGDFL